MKTKTIICDHPLIEHKIALLRDVNTDTKQFRELIEEISMLMAYEALKDIDTVEKELNRADLRDIFLKIYSNPVLSKELLAEKLELPGWKLQWGR